MSFDLLGEIDRRRNEAFELYAEHVSPLFVRTLRTIGFTRQWKRGVGAHLFDEDGVRFLDLVGGLGVFAIGRNHPVMMASLEAVIGAQLGNLARLDCPILVGLLAEKLLELSPPNLARVLFSNSGTEAVEAAMKFARAATRRDRIAYCEGAFHGLTYGSLSINGDDFYKEGFGSLVGNCVRVPFDDLDALEHLLRPGDVACLIVEPIQGNSVRVASDAFLRGARELCDRHGTLLVFDEIQCGLGRTGRFYASDWSGVQADIVAVSKALSGGYVPVGATLFTKDVFDRVYPDLRSVGIHGSTFGKNDLAMAAGLTTLHVLVDEALIENALARGEQLLRGLRSMVGRHECVKDVRGRGLMIGIEFGPPTSIALRASWKVIESANRGLFCQAITIPLYEKHHILAQVASRGSHVIRLLPAYTLTEADVDFAVRAFEDVVEAAHRVPGTAWDLLATLVKNMRTVQ